VQGTTPGYLDAGAKVVLLGPTTAKKELFGSAEPVGKIIAFLVSAAAPASIQRDPARSPPAGRRRRR
jgi:hypothetical protein